MDLFDHLIDPQENLLPCDGIVNYHGTILLVDVADAALATFLDDIAWQPDEMQMNGRRVVTKRKVAWYGDAPYAYAYSSMETTRIALPWTPLLRDLKTRVETASGLVFNSCLLNLYHNGSEGMAWHADAEKYLKPNGAIASLSLGAQRRFAFKHRKTGEVIAKILPHGSLLVMRGTTQTHWLHRLPPVTGVSAPRVNLTFRMIAASERL